VDPRYLANDSRLAEIGAISVQRAGLQRCLAIHRLLRGGEPAEVANQRGTKETRIPFQDNTFNGTHPASLDSAAARAVEDLLNNRPGRRFKLAANVDGCQR
jgi:hypothetical protein